METVTARELWLILPLLVIFVTSLVPLFAKILRGNKEQAPLATLFQVELGLLIAALLLTISHFQGREFIFGKALVVDGISTWSLEVILMITAIATLFTYRNPNTSRDQYSENVFLLLNSMLGAMILCLANDLIVAFIGLEIMSLCLYILIALSHEQKLAKEAAFKYFILGSFASALFLYGLALIYGTTGTSYLDMLINGIMVRSGFKTLLWVGIIFLSVGLCFKVALFPFHAWAPDVYQGAPTPVTAFMATAVKLASFVIFLRFIVLLPVGDSQTFVFVLQWVSVLTILAGNIGAILQSDLKRILAYSSVAHSGYIMIGLLAALVNPSSGGISATLFYLWVYAFMNLGAFGIVCLLESDSDRPMTLDSLNGLAHKRPVLAVFFTLFLLSLAGIPPLAGFVSKFYIFSAGIQADLVWLVVWAVIGSVISVYYYLRPIVSMYMYPENKEVSPSFEIGTRFSVLIAAIAVTIMGIFAQPFLSAIVKSASTIGQ